MSVLARYTFAQGANLRAFAATLVGGLLPSRKTEAAGEVAVSVTLPPLRSDLIDDYVAHVGGDPARYIGTVPSHLFPQWTMPHLLKLLRATPYSPFRTLNGGCRLTTHALLPRGEPLTLVLKLAQVDEGATRTLLHFHATMSTTREQNAVEAEIQLLVPARTRTRSKDATKKEPARVAQAAEELSRLELARLDGLRFALLTGDFNPIHWSALYARMFGFRGVILQGFSAMARAMETIVRTRGGNDPASVPMFEAKFLAPIALPSQVGVYVDGAQVWIGKEPGGRANLAGSYTLASSQPARS